MAILKLFKIFFFKMSLKIKDRKHISNKPSLTKKNNAVLRIQKSDFSQSQSISSPIDDILHFQRTIGNQAVQGLFKSGIIQTKLKIGTPNDIYEQEADKVAEQVMRMPEQVHQGTVITNVQSTSPILQRSPSRIIPDLENTTVSSISSVLPHAVSVSLRQRIINEIIADRRSKGTNFNIMEGGHPVYVGAFPSVLLRQGLSPNANGVTVPANSPPVNTGNRPLVLIGPTAFGTSRDPLNHRLVRIYSSIMHEYQHALQWQQPATARAMGRHRREVEAFFWEIENSRRTGLFRQPGPFQNVWDEAMRHWQAFVNSPAWNSLSAFERARYARWYDRISEIAIAALGSRVVLQQGTRGRRRRRRR